MSDALDEGTVNFSGRDPGWGQRCSTTRGAPVPMSLQGREWRTAGGQDVRVHDEGLADLGPEGGLVPDVRFGRIRNAGYGREAHGLARQPRAEARIDSRGRDEERIGLSSASTACESSSRVRQTHDSNDRGACTRHHASPHRHLPLPYPLHISRPRPVRRRRPRSDPRIRILPHQRAGICALEWGPHHITRRDARVLRSASCR